jgi:hypothetical protein
MFGYVVRPISIPNCAEEIIKIQKDLLCNDFSVIFNPNECEVSLYYVFECRYVYEQSSDEISLSHLFFNFTDAIK